MTYILWIIFAVLVGLLGEKRKIGFGWALFWSIILSPLIGLVVVLLSDKKSNNKVTAKHRQFRELGEKAEFKSQFKEAVDYYMDSLYHLEHDYKNQKITKQIEEKRQKYILEIKDKIENVKISNPNLFKK